MGSELELRDTSFLLSRHRRFDGRKLFWALYAILAIVYIVIGLQPVNSQYGSVAAGVEERKPLSIPAVELSTEIIPLALDNNRLIAPERMAGSYSSHPSKTLIIGHSSTVFANLHQIRTGSEILYNDKKYLVAEVNIVEKSEISMNKILAPSDVDAIILMTCAGDSLGGQDYTHRLIVEAVAQ